MRHRVSAGLCGNKNDFMSALQRVLQFERHVNLSAKQLYVICWGSIAQEVSAPLSYGIEVGLEGLEKGPR